MRACYLPNQVLAANAELVLTEGAFHHVVLVCRLKQNDEILLLNGEGVSAKAVLTDVAKKKATVRIGNQIERAPAPAALDVLLGVPKKEALELMLKMATELGVRKVYLLRSAYSQEKLPELSRMEAMLHSALEQSNNPWVPQLIILKEWSEVPWSHYQRVLCFDPSGSEGSALSFTKNDGILTLLGPEGGFSDSERSLIGAVAHAALVKWRTPILRAPTALAMAVGWVTARQQ